jgi:hypothetical protein
MLDVHVDLCQRASLLGGWWGRMPRTARWKGPIRERHATRKPLPGRYIMYVRPNNVFWCKHGPLECRGNMMELCVRWGLEGFVGGDLRAGAGVPRSATRARALQVGSAGSCAPASSPARGPCAASSHRRSVSQATCAQTIAIVFSLPPPPDPHKLAETHIRRAHALVRAHTCTHAHTRTSNFARAHTNA